MNRMMVVAAHPDDEILEVGGTVGFFAESVWKTMLCSH